MFAGLTDFILNGIRTHGILAVILGVVIETIIVPLPSPIIIMAAGFILIRPGSPMQIALNALSISIIAGLAQTIGSFLVYGFAYKLGKPFIERYEKYHGVSWDDIKRFQKKFSKGRKEDFTLFLLRAIPIMPLSVISGVAGIIEMKPKNYAISTFLGVIPRNFFLAILGFSMGEVYHVIAERIDNVESIVTIVIVLMIIAYAAGHKTGFFEKIRYEILK